MTNQERRQIITEAKAKGYTGSYVDLFRQAAQNPEMLVAETPEQKQAGLRPLHKAGRTDASMAFKDVPPNTPFNTVGMKAPIDIKKYDEQGHLVKSYEDVPPGLTNIDSGPARGTVLETPARMQEGGPVKEETGPRRPPPPEPKYDDPSTYNYQGWLDSGGISQINSEDGEMHQHSVDPYTGMWLKSKKHKTAWKEHLHSQLSPDPFFKKNMSVVNPEGYFGEDQLQYAPRKKAQEGTFLDIDPRLLNRIEVPDIPQTSVKPNIMGDRENEGAQKRFEADQKRRDAIEKGINPNLAFMMPPGLGADSKAKAAYQYDNPMTSNIGQIASGIGFLPIDRGLDIALTAAGSAIRKGAGARAFKKFESEIDWGKWNPDTPNHPVLMDEYKQIEFTTKRNGTWMKNADGSKFKGSPEQFVQQQSSHFKRAYPQGHNKIYHGTGRSGGVSPLLDHDPYTFAAGRELASRYSRAPASLQHKVPLARPGQMGMRIGNTDLEASIFHLYQPRSTNKYGIISQLDSYPAVEIGGKSKEFLGIQADFQKNRIIPQYKERIAAAKAAGEPASKIATMEKNLALAERNEATYRYWVDNYDRLVQRTPSNVPDFEKTLLADSRRGAAEAGLRERASLNTDQIADHMVDEGVDYVNMYGLNDDGWSPHVTIHANKPGQYLKSTIGNVGFFDLNNPNIFKAMVPLGGAGAAFQASSSGKRDTYKKGGYIKKSKKRRRAQQGQAVDYLLGALGQQGDMSAAEIGAQQARDAAAITSGAQRDLEAEKENVQRVRKNIIPTAERIAKGWENLSGEDKEAYENILDYNPAPAGTTPEAKPLGPLRDMMQNRPEGLKEIMPNYNLHLANPGAYGSQRGIYCTTMGCFAYEEAGARRITDSKGRPIRGNETFVRETKKGVTGFEEVPASERQPGDMTVITGPSKRNYNKPHSPENTVIRPHHTVIYSGEAERPTSLENIGREALDWMLGNKRPARDYDYNNPGAIKAYSAETGDMHKFQETVRSNELPSDSDKQSLRFYRYIGQTPQAQRAVTDAKHNQSQADLAAQALQQQADLAAQMPEREVDNVALIDRREAEQIETENPTADIVTTPKKKKKKKRRSAKDVVENVTNKIAGEVYETKDRKQSIREIRRRYNDKIQEIKGGQ